MMKFLSMAVALATFFPGSSVFAIDYLVHIENRGFEDFVGDGELPRDEILSSMQFMASSDKPTRVRFSHGPALVTAIVTIKSEKAGKLLLEVDFSEKTRAQADVSVGDGVNAPTYSLSKVETQAAVQLGESLKIGGLASSSNSRVDGGPEVRKRSQHGIVLRVTEFKAGALTPEEVEEADQMQLLGIWNVTELIRDGQPAQDATVKQMEFGFVAQGRLRAPGLDSTNQIREFDFELDAGQAVKRLTLFPTAGRWKGIPIGAIYELKGDVLRLAIGEFDSAKVPSRPNNSDSNSLVNPVPVNFPNKFESTAGSSIRLITLKRKNGSS